MAALLFAEFPVAHELDTDFIWLRCQITRHCRPVLVPWVRWSTKLSRKIINVANRQIVHLPHTR